MQDILPSNYNNQQSPNVEGEPVNINVSLALLAFHKVSESDQSFRTDVFIHLKWVDKRINLPRSLLNSNNIHDKLILSSNWVSRLWIPSLNFRNARSSAIFSSMTPAMYITINNESEIFLAAKMSLDLNCAMDFSNYPFDTQDCQVEVASRMFVSLFTFLLHSVLSYFLSLLSLTLSVLLILTFFNHLSHPSLNN